MNRLFIIIIGLMISGCAVKPFTKEIKQKFVNRFERDSTNIQSLIDIDGYYQMVDHRKVSFYSGANREVLDSTCVNMVFFKDGTFVNGPDCDNDRNKSDFINSTDSNCFYGYHPSYWGIYRIEGDTIIVQYISQSSFGTPWVFAEEWFKVLDRKTLKYIYTKLPLEQDDYIDTKDWASEYTVASFKQVVMPPPPICWLKTEKWLWKDEEGWKKYMERLTNINKKREK
jgi:hypothetical protein